MEQSLVWGQLKFHLMCSGGCRISSGSHLFAADANEGNRDVGWAQDKVKEGNRYGIQCKLLRLIPSARGEHLASQLLWVAA